MEDRNPAIIFLMGPTASGKTDIAAKLYDEFLTGLISVDAAQVYRYMNIGTAKPDQSFLNKYPHELIDIKNPDETYSAAEFCDDAKKSINQFSSKGCLSLLVGGTMFYFSSLENGLSNLPSSDLNVRNQIDMELKSNGLGSLYNELILADPGIKRRISSEDTQRVQRAVEILRITGKPPSDMMSDRSISKVKNPIIKIGLFTSSRKVLHKRIEQRFFKMLDSGLVNEVQEVLEKFPQANDMPSMRSVGYRQVYEYLTGEIDHGRMIEKSISATRQLAKRQLTWLRNQSGVVWFDADQENISDSICSYLHAHPMRIT